MGNYGDEPLCALYSTAIHDTPAQEFPDTISIGLTWKPGKGQVLKFNGIFSTNPSLRVESVDTGDAWDVTLDAPEGGMAARRVTLNASGIDALIHNLAQGHPMAITVTDSAKGSIQHVAPATYAKIAVPMYRACVKALTDEAPIYKERPQSSYGQLAKDGACAFSQNFPVGKFPASVRLSVNDLGAEIVVWRSTLEWKSHRKFKRRTKPDRVDARQLFGETFELLDETRYPITPAHLEQLAADLSRGATRSITLTEPDGAQTTLAFGGPLGKPSAAMFGACREATFSPPGD